MSIVWLLYDLFIIHTVVDVTVLTESVVDDGHPGAELTYFQARARFAAPRLMKISVCGWNDLCNVLYIYIYIYIYTYIYIYIHTISMYCTYILCRL